MRTQGQSLVIQLDLHSRTSARTHTCEWNLHLNAGCEGCCCLFIPDKSFILGSTVLSVCELDAKTSGQTSLVIQSSRIRLPVRETQVWSLVWEDPTCLGPAKSEHHGYWSASTLEPVLGSKRSPRNGSRAGSWRGASHCSSQPEKSPGSNEDLKNK